VRVYADGSGVDDGSGERVISIVEASTTPGETRSRPSRGPASPSSGDPEVPDSLFVSAETRE
jgi:hypothetical protein